MLYTFRFLLHYVKSAVCRSHGRRGHRGTEYERTCCVLDVVDVFLVAGDESSQGAETLGERSHNEVNLVRETEMVGGSRAVPAEYSQSVSVVHHYCGIVLFCKTADLRKRTEVAEHGIYTVNDYEFGSICGTIAQLGLERVHIVVSEFVNRAEAQARTVDYASVVGVVEQYVSVPASESAHDSEVYLEARAESNSIVLADKLRKAFLELLVDVKGSVEETASGTAGSVFVYCCLRCLLEARVIGQSKIGV